MVWAARAEASGAGVWSLGNFLRSAKASEHCPMVVQWSSDWFIMASNVRLAVYSYGCQAGRATQRATPTPHVPQTVRTAGSLTGLGEA